MRRLRVRGQQSGDAPLRVHALIVEAVRLETVTPRHVRETRDLVPPGTAFLAVIEIDRAFHVCLSVGGKIMKLFSGDKMGAIFPSMDWLNELDAKLNSDERYAEIAKKWEGDMIIVIEPEGNLKEQESLLSRPVAWQMPRCGGT